MLDVFYHSSESMPELSNHSAQLVIGSPPFTNHPDGKTLDKLLYLRFVRTVFREASRVLKPGRLLVIINTDLRDHSRYNRGDVKFNGLLWQKHSSIRKVAQSIDFRCVETKIWAKSLSRNIYRYGFAYIQFFQKTGEGKSNSVRESIRKSFAPDVWLLQGGGSRRDSRGFVFRDAFHPEIVSRCLEQFTAPGDLVVCPFAGSGTVPAVARLLGRRCVAFETDKHLKPLIEETVARPERFPAFLRLLQTTARLGSPAKAWDSESSCPNSPKSRRLAK
jgi:DNA modification methylase